MTTHRRRLDVVRSTHAPIYVVWELTLACDHACTHCGSRAGVARDRELSTDEAVAVAGQLADAGTREVILIGGEAYLHDGCRDVIRALVARGVRVGMTTGGRGVTVELARELAAAGLAQASVSIDGLAPAHDRMRARVGSFADGLAALANLRAAGVAISANTNLNRSNRDDLEALYLVLRDAGVRAWQVQLTAPLGRAADRVAMVLQPWDLLDLVPRIAALKRQARADGITVMPGNNLGYFGPEETLLRSLGADDRDHWRGCQAGKYVMGIESDGAVKGCPSLQTAAYVGGNLRDAPLATIWRDAPELTWNRGRTVDALWGYCRTCDFAAECLGGCTFTAHAILGRPGNNPYCHYRARSFAKRGLRERLVSATPADGLPFDGGTFTIEVEPLDAPDPGAVVGDALVQLDRRPRRRGPEPR
ncbi:MAG: radical SAM protein [Kofleriaceae bacterium]|nr:radical SAM protein [Kofleriaceae bacterium]MBP9166458.1 radical SAM protein [Kofleriaceae bacterium]MBP9860311.1 radical SAM protein [Kofleriaceae bacterium]